MTLRTMSIKRTSYQQSYHRLLTWAVHSDNSFGYEKLNPETLECLRELGITSDSQDHVNQQDILHNEVLPSAFRATSLVNSKSYENLNQRTVESFQGSGFPDGTQDYINQKDFVPTVLSPRAYKGTHSDISCGYE